MIYDIINSKKEGILDDVYLGEYSKMPGTVLRLSAVLHILEEVRFKSVQARPYLQIQLISLSNPQCSKKDLI